MVYKFFNKKTSVTCANKFAVISINSDIMHHQQWTGKLCFVGNTCDADLADMQIISKFNKGFRFLLCVIDNCSKYSLAIHWN